MTAIATRETLRPIHPPVPGKPDLDGAAIHPGHLIAFGAGQFRAQTPYDLADGRLALETVDSFGNAQWWVWPSHMAYADYVGSIAHRDPEAHAGRFFPSDYRRLKITEVKVPSSYYARGYTYAPVCTCTTCGQEHAHSETTYRVGGETPGAREYFPFCLSCR